MQLHVEGGGQPAGVRGDLCGRDVRPTGTAPPEGLSHGKITPKCRFAPT